MVPRTSFEFYSIFTSCKAKSPSLLFFLEHYRWGNVFLLHQIKEEHIEKFYNFYINTTEKKFGAAYLTKDFWFLLISRLKHRVLLILVDDNNQSVAGAINLFDSKSIYGRNWGSLKNINFLLQNLNKK